MPLILPQRELYRPPSGLLAMRGGMRGGFQNLDGMGQFPLYGSAGPTSLQDVVASACIHVESTDSASYSGSGQTWANIVASPADGSDPTNISLVRGADATATTDDPTFNGTPGDPGAYWSFDGGDAFTGTTDFSTDSFLSNVHRTTGGVAWTIGCIVKIAASASTKGVWSTMATAGTRGIRLQSSATEELQFFQRGGSASVSVNTGYTHGSGYEFLMIGCAAGGGTHSYWFNSRTASTFSLAYNTVTVNSNFWCVGGISATATRISSGSEARSFFAFNELLNDTQAGAVIDYFNDLHGVTYA